MSSSNANLRTSSQFASSIATGSDWREAAKKVLESLQEAKTGEGDFNIGFLYITDHLTEETESILNLFHSVLEIKNWVGCVGLGVFGNDQASLNEPAIAAMIGHIPDNDFHLLSDLEMEEETIPLPEKTQNWIKENDIHALFTHMDPLCALDPGHCIKKLEEHLGGFILGGVASGRKDLFHYAEKIAKTPMSGVAFTPNVKIASNLSQGCIPIGEPHLITSGEDHIIRELDQKAAVNVFEEDLRQMAIKKINKDPNTIKIDEASLFDEQAIPEEFKSIFKGEICIGFPIEGADTNHMLVRNMMGINESGELMVAEMVQTGERIIFVQRDDDTVRQDLSKMLVELRERVHKEEGTFAPKGAIYVSCLARASLNEHENGNEEMTLIREILGDDIPLVGFYAGGEILNARLYGFTGIITLFL